MIPLRVEDIEKQNSFKIKSKTLEKIKNNFPFSCFKNIILNKDYSFFQAIYIEELSDRLQHFTYEKKKKEEYKKAYDEQLNQIFKLEFEEVIEKIVSLLIRNDIINDQLCLFLSGYFDNKKNFIRNKI